MVSKTTEKKVVGIHGPDSTGQKFGRQTQAVFDYLRRQGTYAVLPIEAEGTFSSQEDCDIILSIGKHATGVDNVLEHCQKERIPVLGAGQHWENKDPDGKCLLVYAHNLSLALNKIFAHIQDGDLGKLVSIGEYHHANKNVPTKTIIEMASAGRIDPPVKDVNAFSGIESVSDMLRQNIPQKHRDDFGIYVFTFHKNGKDEMRIVELYGRADAAESAGQIIDFLFSKMGIKFLDPKRYTVPQLVRAKYL